MVYAVSFEAAASDCTRQSLDAFDFGGAGGGTIALAMQTVWVVGGPRIGDFVCTVISQRPGVITAARGACCARVIAATATITKAARKPRNERKRIADLSFSRLACRSRSKYGWT